MEGIPGDAEDGAAGRAADHADSSRAAGGLTGASSPAVCPAQIAPAIGRRIDPAAQRRAGYIPGPLRFGQSFSALRSQVGWAV
jgi:hypothetical protein